MSKWLHVGELLKTAAELYPDKLGAKDLKRGMTFYQWNERVNRLANGLLSLGLKKGDKIAIIAYNCVEWMEIYAACAKSGLVAVPIMFRMPPAEYEYILKNSEAKAFIVENEFAKGADSIRGNLDPILSKNYIYFGDTATPSGFSSYEEIIARSSEKEPDVNVSHEDIWVMTYTSGTTGKPKGVVRTHESLIAFYLINLSEFGFNRTDIGLLVMPMCHINSIYYSFLFTYTYGGVCIYNMKSFDPEHFLKTISDENITFTSLVPTHYIMILSLPDDVKSKFDVSKIRKLLCSSAPARKDTKLAILDYFKNSELFEAYGSTEAGIVTLLRPEEQFTKLGSIGREVIGTRRIKILDEDGVEVKDGEVGELYSSSPMLFKEYWKLPEATKTAFVGDYFSAGDMAKKDKDGYLYLVDRKKNMIITGGENVYPSEVENVVGAHDKVKDVAVIGVPDKKWGECVTAVIVLHEGVSPSEKLQEEIKNFCKGKIAGYKIPKTVEFIKDADMPRTATGKILHRELRTRYGTWSEN